MAVSADVSITLGQRLRWDGELWTVAGLEGERVTLEGRGTVRSVTVRTLATGMGLEDDEPPSLGVGLTMNALDDPAASALTELVEHVREVLTGFRSGTRDVPRLDEPRAEYGPGAPMTERYRSKAAELGCSVSTVRRMVSRYRKQGPAGLLDARGQRCSNPFGTTDPRWVDAARTVLDEHISRSRPTKKILIARTNQRVIELHGDSVALPSESSARRVLSELERGTNAFSGSTKAKRSISNRPASTYGRFVASRPGEFVMLDTTPLDVFALDRLTQRWVRCQLTVAMDLQSECIVGLRLTAVSTKAVDVAGILAETFSPESRRLTSGGILPYVGLPTAVIVDADRTDSALSGLPGVAPETLVVDHDRIFISRHVFAVCERFGINIQPARRRTPTDKAQVERWFRTLRESLLEALPGYKGPDVHSRGDDPEGEAFYFVDELEQIIREWIVEVYHRRPHRGLVVAEAPAIRLSPRDAFEHGLARAGRLRLPSVSGQLYDFLPVVWRRVQHYGVDFRRLQYDAACLDRARHRSCPLPDSGARWPFRYDPDDLSALFFQDLESGEWHEVPWKRRDELGRPFSSEALELARSYVDRTGRPFDEVAALGSLLDRWDAGLHANLTERRVAIRADEQRSARNDRRITPDEPLTIGAAYALGSGVSESDEAVGLDDDLDELDGSDDDFYGSAFPADR